MLAVLLRQSCKAIQASLAAFEELSVTGTVVILLHQHLNQVKVQGSVVRDDFQSL